MLLQKKIIETVFLFWQPHKPPPGPAIGAKLAQDNDGPAGLLTESEAEVCRLAEANLTELAGKDGTDRGEAEATAAAAAQTQAAVQHMLVLTSCPPGTAAIPFEIDKEKLGRKKGVLP